MQIVIEMPEELYDYIQTEKYDEHLDRRFDYMSRFAVKDGTPLPDHYGRLIDCQAAMSEFKRIYFDNATVLRCAEIILSNASTIIPAMKGDSDASCN